MEKKSKNIGLMLVGLALSIGTIYVYAYVAGKGWKKANA